MSSGSTIGTVYVSPRGRGQMECATEVGWVCCDAPGCRRFKLRADCGDSELVCQDAEADGWTIGHNDGDFCCDHAPKSET